MNFQILNRIKLFRNNLNNIVFSFTVLFFLLNCSNKETVQPRMQVPGYKAELIVQDTFDQASDQWIIEGEGDYRSRSDDWNARVYVTRAS